jgi:hypothetical protein
MQKQSINALNAKSQFAQSTPSLMLTDILLVFAFAAQLRDRGQGARDKGW